MIGHWIEILNMRSLVNYQVISGKEDTANKYARGHYIQLASI